ncbi:hypothetical protein [Haloferula sargassicola]|uniref:Lipoprotein n=1 Tax=Haloferula sargassicola TaxID=490096 RepID=A0ABP9UH87_9BACT
MRFLHLAVPAILAGALSSCGTMQSISSATSNGVDKLGKSLDSGFNKVASVATSPFKPGIPVVEARPEDFEKVQTGHDQAIAYQNAQRQRRSSLWGLFSGPADFEEPALPEMNDASFDGGLLPPANP